MRYGNEFHKAAENFLDPRKATPLPAKFKYAKPALIAMRDITEDRRPELKMGLTEMRAPCKFFDKDVVWYRGVADLISFQGSTAYVFDHKTGSNTKYADPGQLELMALSVFAWYPMVEKIKAALVFYLPNEIVRRSYTRDDIDGLWEKWLKKFERLKAAHDSGVFNPKPSGLCRRHCIVTDCAHNGRNEL